MRVFYKRCGCENGPSNGSSEQPPSIMIFSDLWVAIRFRCVSFPTRYLEVCGSFLPSIISRWSHQPLSLCRSFFAFVSVRLGTSRIDLTAPVTHQVLGLQKNRISFSAIPVPDSGTQKIFGSRPCPNGFIDRTHGYEPPPRGSRRGRSRR